MPDESGYLYKGRLEMILAATAAKVATLAPIAAANAAKPGAILVMPEYHEDFLTEVEAAINRRMGTFIGITLEGAGGASDQFTVTLRDTRINCVILHNPTMAQDVRTGHRMSGLYLAEWLATGLHDWLPEGVDCSKELIASQDGDVIMPAPPEMQMKGMQAWTVRFQTQLTLNPEHEAPED